LTANVVYLFVLPANSLRRIVGLGKSKEKHPVPSAAQSIFNPAMVSQWIKLSQAQPGLIPQMSGFLTNWRIWGCTMCCNHVSDFVNVHLMHDFTVNKTLLAVKAFKKVLPQANCHVKHYHADNGAFAHTSFMEEVNCKKSENYLLRCWCSSSKQNNRE
jgi:hypothetical protein